MKRIIGKPHETNNKLICLIQRVKINDFYLKNKKDFRDQILSDIDPKDDVLDIGMAMRDKHQKIIFELMLNKNHDYGEAWRDMRVSSLTDLILQKLLRVKQIEENQGKTIVSEGIDANYHDMVNYSIFALIHLNARQ